MSKIDRPNGALARNVRRLGHLDLPGAGQVTVAGHYAYVGHIPNKQNLGTSIVDISDPANPRVVAAAITLDDSDLAQPQGSRRRRSDGRQSRAQSDADRAPRRAAPGRAPRVAGRAWTRADPRGNRRRSSISPRPILRAVEAAEKQPYRNGGFRIYDVSDPASPS